jgi:predicted transcriptional regulator
MSTSREACIIDAICAKPAATVRELGRMAGLSSSSSIYEQLVKLEARGRIRRSECADCGGAVWTVR